MATFTYTATDQTGKAASGERAAATRQELIARLRAENLIVTSVKDATAADTPSETSVFMNEFFLGRVKSGDLMTCTRQLSALLKAGISLTDALHTIAHGMSSVRLRKILLQVRTDVQRGETLTDSMRKHAVAFDQLYISMIHAGETSGGLSQNVERLSNYLERKEDFRRKLKSAMAYPVFVLAFFTILTSVIMLFIVPKFKEIFEGFGATLPPLTTFFMNISMFLRQNLVFILPALVILGLAARFARRTERGGKWVDSIILKTPFLGKLALRAAVQRFAVTLSTLLANGIPLTDSLRIAASTLNNSVLEAAANTARDNVVRGRSLAESIAGEGHFPHLLARMVHVGEESGSLSNMLQDVSTYYEKEVDHALSRITAVVEPLLICGMGVVVLITVIAIYLPIFTLGKSVSGG